MKSITIISQIVCLLACSITSANDVTLPALEEMESIAADRGDISVGVDSESIRFEVGDFEKPEPGKLSGADLKWLDEIQRKTDDNLNRAPAGELGQNAQWYPYMRDLNGSLATTIANRSAADLLGIMDPLRVFIERESEAEWCEQLQTAESYLTQCGSYMIRALAYHVGDQNGVLEEGLLRDAVKLFGNGKLVDETAWDEDDVMPIDSAGLFIVNPVVVLDELKKRPVERARFFLCGVSEASEFFRRYGGGGDGLEVLKVKYGANREVIEGKYAEAVAWLAGQGGGE